MNKENPWKRLERYEDGAIERILSIRMHIAYDPYLCLKYDIDYLNPDMDKALESAIGMYDDKKREERGG